MKNLDFDDNKEINLILCKKCYQNGEYIIPFYQINKENHNLEFKCSRYHILNEVELLRIKNDEEIKTKIIKCRKDHEGNVFCGWCDECKKNICFLCISGEMKKKHKYILFMEIMPEEKFKIIYDSQMKKLESLLNRYTFYCPYLHGEINQLSQLIGCFKATFNLYYYAKYFSYQIINNIKLIISDLDIITNPLETKFHEYQYLYFFSHLLKRNNKNKMNQINKIDRKIKKK